MLRLLQVRHQLRKAVTTVKVLGIPLLALIKGRRLAQLSLCNSHLCHRHRLRFQGATAVDLVYVAEHHLQRGAVADKMVDVEEEVEMLRILEQTYMEQTVLINIERHDHLLLLSLDVVDMFDVQSKRLGIVDGLQGIALLIQLYTGEERGMGSDCRLNGFL